MKIAFFGLGNMGFPIARNLIASGHTVISAIHSNSERGAALIAAGGQIAASPAEAAADAELIFSIVPNDTALEELFLNEAMMRAIPAGSTIVEMTSSSAAAVRRVAQAYAPLGVSLLDAPVSGGVKGAANGTMSMICAGEPAVFDRLEPVLSSISGSRCYVGAEPGLGKMIKSLNNLLSAVNKTAVGEVWRIAAANGIAPEAFYEAISTSSGNSAALRASFPKIRDNDYSAGFTVALMRKDLELAMGLAQDMRLPLAETTLEYYRRAAVFDQEDSTAVAKIRFAADDPI